MDELSELPEKIKTWLTLDNKINEINTILKKVKEKKQLLEDTITTEIAAKNLENNLFKIDNCKINYSEVLVVPNISLKLLEEVFDKYISEQSKIKLLDAIKRKRDEYKKKNIILKRRVLKKRSRKVQRN